MNDNIEGLKYITKIEVTKPVTQFDNKFKKYDAISPKNKEQTAYTHFVNNNLSH